MRPLSGRSEIPREYWANRFAENVGILFLSNPWEQVNSSRFLLTAWRTAIP